METLTEFSALRAAANRVTWIACRI